MSERRGSLFVADKTVEGICMLAGEDTALDMADVAAALPEPAGESWHPVTNKIAQTINVTERTG